MSDHPDHNRPGGPEAPSDEAPSYETSAGETSAGETSAGETSAGETPELIPEKNFFEARRDRLILPRLEDHVVLGYELVQDTGSKLSLFSNRSGEAEHEKLLFGRSGESAYRVLFRRYGPELIVTGDLGGTAIYAWGGGGHSLRWMGGLGLQYFSEKCSASAKGKGYTSFSARLAERNIGQRIAGKRTRYETPGSPDMPESARRYLKVLQELHGNVPTRREDFKRMLWDHVEESRHANGDFSTDDAIDLLQSAEAPDLGCQFHLEALRLATEDLQYGNRP